MQIRKNKSKIQYDWFRSRQEIKENRKEPWKLKLKKESKNRDTKLHREGSEKNAALKIQTMTEGIKKSRKHKMGEKFNNLKNIRKIKLQTNPKTNIYTERFRSIGKIGCQYKKMKYSPRRDPMNWKKITRKLQKIPENRNLITIVVRHLMDESILQIRKPLQRWEKNQQ